MSQSVIGSSASSLTRSSLGLSPSLSGHSFSGRRTPSSESLHRSLTASSPTANLYATTSRGKLNIGKVSHICFVYNSNFPSKLLKKIFSIPLNALQPVPRRSLAVRIAPLTQMQPARRGFGWIQPAGMLVGAIQAVVHHNTDNRVDKAPSNSTSNHEMPSVSDSLFVSEWEHIEQWNFNKRLGTSFDVY